MKNIIFDSGPIISLAEIGLLPLLTQLKKQFNGEFLIPESVKYELIDKPLTTHKYKFEALQVLSLIQNSTLTMLSDPQVKNKAKELERIANNIITAYKHPIQLLQKGELEVLAAALIYQVDAIVVDERVTRTLIEAPHELKKLMERRLHTGIHINENTLHEFQKIVANIPLIRSTELLTIAFEKGLLNNYIVNIPKPRKELLDSVLWGAKLHGCSITEQEIETIVKTVN